MRNPAVVVTIFLDILMSASAQAGAPPTLPITCQIPAVMAGNIWMQALPWQQALMQFRDHSAAWISTAPAETVNGQYRCHDISRGRKGVFASMFTVTQPGRYDFEFLVDNSGRLHVVWVRGDVREVLNLYSNEQYATAGVDLINGQYEILLEDFDYGVASGAIASIRFGNTVIKNTADGTWFGYDVPENTDVLTLIGKADDSFD